MTRDDVPSGVDSLKVPSRVTGLRREMFVLILRELGKLTPQASLGSEETVLVERLAAELARIKEVDPLLRFGYAIASAAEAIREHCWLVASEFAAQLQLPQDALERLLAPSF